MSRRDLITMRRAIDDVLNGHLDNTNAGCRIDLDGHDCCYTCNLVENMLLGARRDDLLDVLADDNDGKSRATGEGSPADG